MVKRKYPTNIILSDYSYTVEEVASLYNVTQKTVLRWIKFEGLVKFSYAKKFFIHSGELLSFLEVKNFKHKVKTPDGSIYCVKCRTTRKMETRIEIKSKNNKMARCKVGTCPVCKTACQQYIDKI